jgi:hypothetical protein
MDTHILYSKTQKKFGKKYDKNGFSQNKSYQQFKKKIINYLILLNSLQKKPIENIIISFFADAYFYYYSSTTHDDCCIHNTTNYSISCFFLF